MANRSQADLDNYSNQLNPNNEEYWQSREEPDGEIDFEEFGSFLWE